MHLAVGDALLAALQIRQLLVDLDLAPGCPLLDLRDLHAPIPHLALDLGPQPHGLLARLDLSLPPHRLGLAVCGLDGRAALLLGLLDARRASAHEDEPRRPARDEGSDECCDDREHAHSFEGFGSRGIGHGCSHPAPVRSGRSGDRRRRRRPRPGGAP